MEHQVPSQSFLAAISALPCRFVGPKQRQSDWFIDFVSFFSARADISMACRQICQCQCQCLVVCSDEEAGQKLETDSTRRSIAWHLARQLSLGEAPDGLKEE